MTFFDNFLMQILSKYYKENYYDFKIFFLKFFVEYSKIKQSQKNPKGVGVIHVIPFAPQNSKFCI